MGVGTRTRIFLAGAVLCGALLLSATGCDLMPGVTPSVFLPPLGDCTPIPGNCSTVTLTGDLTDAVQDGRGHGYSVMGDTTGGSDNFYWTGPDQVYSLTLCYPRRLTFSTCNSPVTWDSVLILTDADCNGEVLNNPGAPSEDDGCGLASGPSKFSVTLPAGLYHLIVDGYAGAQGPYVLDVTTP